jgi:translocation and assembly module TamB
MRRLSALLLLALLPGLLWAQESPPADDATTRDDRGFLTAFLEDNLSGLGRTVRVTGFAGALSSRATFDEMTIADANGVWLTIRNGAISWNRGALLSGRVEIDEMSAGEIDLPRRPSASGSAATASGFSLPELPVSVEIGTLRAERVVLGQALFGAAAEVSLNGTAKLAGGQGTADFAIKRVDGRDGELTLKGDYSNATRQVTLDLLVSEGADGIAANMIGLPGRPSVVMAVHGSGSIDNLTTDVTLTTDQQPRLNGKITLVSTPAPDGGAAARSFRADVRGDIAPLLVPEYRDFFGNDVSLVAEGARDASGILNLKSLTLASRAVSVAGNLTLAPEGFPLQARLAVQLGLEGDQDVLLPIPGQKTYVRRGNVEFGYNAATGDGWTLDSRLSGFRREGVELTSLRLVGSGRLRRAGTAGAASLAKAAVGGTINFTGGGIQLANPDLNAAVGPYLTGRTVFSWQEGQPLRLPKFGVTGQGYSAEGGINIAYASRDLEVSGKVAARVADMARFSGLAGRPLAGSADLALTGKGGVLSGLFDAEGSISGTDLRVGQAELDRLLQGVARVTVSASRDTERTELRALTLSASTLTATAKGVIRPGASNLSANLDFSDVGVLGARYRGALVAAATLVEGAEGRKVTLTGTGRNLAVGQEMADKLLAGDTALDVSATQAADGRIQLDKLTLSNPNATLKAAASGVILPGASNLSATLDFGDIGILGPGYGGALVASATLVEGAEGRKVTLKGTGRNLAVRQETANKLLAGDTALDVAATQAADGRIRLEKLTLSNPNISASASGVAGDDTRYVDVDARLANFAQLAPGFPGPLVLGGRLTENVDGYGVALDLTGPGNTSATANGTVGVGFKSVDLGLTGGLQSAIFNPFIEPRNIEGPVQFDLRMSGPPGLASLSGTVTTDGTRIVAPTFGFAMQNVGLRAELSGGRAQIDGSADVNTGGRLTINGQAGLTPPFDSDLSVELASVRLRNPDLFETTINGGLKISGPLTGGGLVSGEISLDQTDIRVPSTGFGAQGYSGIIEHRNEPADVRQTRERAGLLKKEEATANGRRPFGLDIGVSAPSRIFVRGRGLDAEMGGALRLSGTTRDIIPVGQFNLIRGRLDILGKRFTIDEGLVQLQGALVPVIRFVAQSQNEGVTSKVIIDGRASEPKISFTSSPELPEEEVVARLLFGRGLSNLSAFQAAQLASAVATLAGRGGEGVVGRLRSSFGLDDLDISADDAGNAAVRAGKYISRNVYTDVVVGADGKSEINLNLDVTKSLSVRGTVGSDGATGLGVFFEKDY